VAGFFCAVLTASRPDRGGRQGARAFPPVRAAVPALRLSIFYPHSYPQKDVPKPGKSMGYPQWKEIMDGNGTFSAQFGKKPRLSGKKSRPSGKKPERYGKNRGTVEKIRGTAKKNIHSRIFPRRQDPGKLLIHWASRMGPLSDLGGSR